MKMLFSRNLEALKRGAHPFKNCVGIVSITYDFDYSKKKGKDYWRLTDSFSYYLGDGSSGEYFVIPKGFITDGASTPRPLWIIIPPWGKYAPAVVVHDYLCRKGIITSTTKTRVASRAETDSILLEALKALKVPKWKCYAMYYGVRAYAIVKGLK